MYTTLSSAANKHTPETPTGGGSRVFESCCMNDIDSHSYDIYPRGRGASLSAYTGNDEVMKKLFPAFDHLWIIHAHQDNHKLPLDS